jgi:type III restriction enzyme
VNVLTVIASESYETFVRDLQSDIRSTLRERPQKVEVDFFTGRTLEVDGEEVSFSAADSKAIYKYLLKNDFLDDADRPSDDFRAMVGEGKFQASAMASCPRGWRRGARQGNRGPAARRLRPACP